MAAARADEPSSLGVIMPNVPNRPSHVEELTNNTLYIMITIPARIYYGYASHNYPSSIDETAIDFDPATYEHAAVYGATAEEFHWNLYWHRCGDDGIVFRLRKVHAIKYETPVYAFEQFVVQGIRNMAKVVGFVHVCKVGGAPHDRRVWVDLGIPPIDNVGILKTVPRILKLISRTAQRSSLRARCTRHWVLRVIGTVRLALKSIVGSDLTTQSFDPDVLTAELLEFAYPNVRYALMGVVRPPIMISKVSIHMIKKRDDKEALEIHAAALAIARAHPEVREALGPARN